MGARTAASFIAAFFTPMKAIISLCTQEGILASDLSRFPAVAAKIPKVIPKSTFRHTVSELQGILDMRDILGFTLLDQSGLKRLVAATPIHKSAQTEYIPPRIWSYQHERLRVCLEDYLQHQSQVEECFNFCVDAYTQNYGSLSAAITNRSKGFMRPFRTPPCSGSGQITGRKFYGPFVHTSDRFGITGLLERWTPPSKGRGTGIKQLTSYLSLIQHVGLAYILNFTLMRRDEGRSLRADCFQEEYDEKLGKIYLVCGETTKTDTDSDARWPTSVKVKLAIDAMLSVSRLRLRCAQATPGCNLTIEDLANPYLLDRSYEPWAGKIDGVQNSDATLRPTYGVRHSSNETYQRLITTYPTLFDIDAVTIRQKDLDIARAICPSLGPNFQVGKPWHFTFHQLRRTGTVNMTLSGLVSDSTMQYQLKHRSRNMTLYYGRGSSTLALNEEVRVMLINAQYETMGREINAVLSERFVSPYGSEHKKKLISDLISPPDTIMLDEMDVHQFEAAARKGKISFRSTVLGACMKRGKCEGDSIDSIANCSGGDGSAPCRDVLFDRNRTEQNQVRLDGIKQQLEATPQNSPLYRALHQEKLGLENYFAYINRGW